VDDVDTHTQPWLAWAEGLCAEIVLPPFVKHPSLVLKGDPEGGRCTALTFNSAFVGHRSCRGQNHLVACQEREGERERGEGQRCSSFRVHKKNK
jgi:hypothetical protein